MVTSGPGLTNIIAAAPGPRGDSTPILALSGQVPTAAVGTDAFQECLAVDLTRPCTKWSYQVKSVEEVRSVVHEAFRVASTGKRGPVHLDLPKDVMTAVLNGASLPLPENPPEIAIDRRAVERASLSCYPSPRNRSSMWARERTSGARRPPPAAARPPPPVAARPPADRPALAHRRARSSLSSPKRQTSR